MDKRNPALAKQLSTELKSGVCMTRQQQRQTNREVIRRLIDYMATCARSWRVPSYGVVVRVLNSEGYRTSRGNLWTSKRLFRMLQREGISGLHGLCLILKNQAVATY